MNSKNLLTLFVVPLILFLFAGCGNRDLTQSLNGTWAIDADRIIAEVPENQRDEAGMYLGMMGSLSFAFDMNEKTITVNSPMGDSETDSFEIDSVTDDSIVLTAANQSNDMTIVFHDSNTIEFRGEMEDELPFPLILVRQ